MRYWSLVLLVWVIATTAWPRLAEAQLGTTGTSLAMSTAYPVVRAHDDTGRNVSSSTDTTLALTITAADCKSSKLKFKFSITVTGYDITQTLQAWATRSTDCSGEYTSATSVTRTCWQVASSIEVVNGVATVELSPALLLGIGADPQFAGNQRVFTNSCDETVIGKGRQSFKVYFLLTNNENKVAASVPQAMYYSMVGPDSPAINDVIAADQSLELKWGTAAVATTEVNYEFFCADNEEPNGCKSSVLEGLGSPGPASSGGAGGDSSTGEGGGGGGTADGVEVAGTAGTPGTDTSFGGSAGESGSDNTAGVAGSLADQSPLTELHCGTRVGRMNLSGFTDSKLKNGNSYAVAMGVRDTFGNLGTLTSYHCEKPRPVTTFFEAYRLDGGKAGGGFCNLGIHPKRSTLPLALGLLGLSAWLRRRHRRSRRGHSNSTNY